MIQLLLQLLLAHIAIDFLLPYRKWKSEWRDRDGTRISAPMVFHLLSYAILLFLFTFRWDLWFAMVVLVIFHWAIDLFIARRWREGTERQRFFIGQFLHLLSITAIWLWVTDSLEQWVSFLQSITFWTYALCFSLLVIVYPRLLQVAISSWTNEINDGDEASLKKAGLYIGILERLFVFLFVVTGHWDAVGFLIAAKSVFRFGDLRDSNQRKLTEYVLIGTLLSFGLAFLTGLICRIILG